MYLTSSDWLACLGMYPVYVIPFARVSFVPRGKLEKPLLKQELLFIPDQHSKLSTSLTVQKSQPLNQLCFSHNPLNKDYYVSISKSRAMSVMCHNPYQSHIRHCLLETSNSSINYTFSNYPNFNGPSFSRIFCQMSLYSIITTVLQGRSSETPYYR